MQISNSLLNKLFGKMDHFEGDMTESDYLYFWTYCCQAEKLTKQEVVDLVRTEELLSESTMILTVTDLENAVTKRDTAKKLCTAITVTRLSQQAEKFVELLQRTGYQAA